MLLVPHAACARPPRPAPSGAYDAAAPGGVGELYTLSLPYELRLAHLERQLAAGERAGAGTAAGARAAGSDPAAAGPQPCGRVCRRCRAPERRGGVRARGRRLGARRAAAGWEPKGRPSWARPRRRPRALLGRVPAARPRRRRGHGRCRGRRRGERGRAGAQHRPAAPQQPCMWRAVQSRCIQTTWAVDRGNSVGVCRSYRDGTLGPLMGLCFWAFVPSRGGGIVLPRTPPHALG